MKRNWHFTDTFPERAEKRENMEQSKRGALRQREIIAQKIMGQVAKVSGTIAEKHCMRFSDAMFLSDKKIDRITAVTVAFYCGYLMGHNATEDGSYKEKTNYSAVDKKMLDILINGFSLIFRERK